MKKNLLIIVLLLSAATVKGQRQHLMYDLKFDDNSVDNKGPAREVFDNHAQIVSDSVKRGGQKSVRMEVKATNTDIKGIRSEFSFKAETTPEHWYGLSIFAPSAYLPDPEPEIVTQWHNTPDFNLGEAWLSPSLSMIVQNGRWIFHTLWDTAKVTIQEHWMGNIYTDLGPVNLNSWTDWAFHIKFSYKADGLVQVYKNGVLVFERKGPNDFNDAVLPYWKVGIYKWVYKDHIQSHHKYHQRVLFYSQIREGDQYATYKDVAPKP